MLKIYLYFLTLCFLVLLTCTFYNPFTSIDPINNSSSSSSDDNPKFVVYSETYPITNPPILSVEGYRLSYTICDQVNPGTNGEGSFCYRATFNDPSPDSYSACIKFMSDRTTDLSAYNYLNFSYKKGFGVTLQDGLYIAMLDKSGDQTIIWGSTLVSDYGINIASDSWQVLKIPLNKFAKPPYGTGTVDITKVEIYLQLGCTSTKYLTSDIHYIDNIYFSVK